MPESDWRLKRPDFSDQDKYEAEGWEKTGKFDIPHRNGKFAPWASFGTVNPLEKIGTLVEYQNDILNMKAITIDFFDQGLVYIEWLKRDNIKIGAPRGLALLINNRWVIKKIAEFFTIDVEVISLKEKGIANKVRLSFVEKQIGLSEFKKTSLLVEREYE